MDLDFSALTDEQLVELITAACRAAVDRGAATEAAARDAFLSARERAAVAGAAASREAERLRQEEARKVAEEAAARVRSQASQAAVADVAAKERNIWARRKGIAQAIEAAGWSVKGDSIVVWLSAAKEKRVFLQQSKFQGATYATLFVTGNGRKPPGSIELNINKERTAFRAAIPAILRAIARDWNEIKVDLEAALAWDGEAIPLVIETPETAKAAL